MEEYTMPAKVRLAPPNSPSSKGRILLFTYAFPPLKSQMSPAILKPMAALSRLGYAIDVVSAEPWSKYILDNSLLPYAEKNFHKITRLAPKSSFIKTNIIPKVRILRTLFYLISSRPDIMYSLRHRAFSHLMDMDLSVYNAIMTWSPFHSINPVMVEIKKHRKVRWIAQFSDPWHGNPLEKRLLNKIWNKWHEPYSIDAADFIVHSSRPSLNMMIERYGDDLKRYSTVIPHCFDLSLFPEREKIRNKKIKIRYIGTLFGERSPQSFFDALSLLLDRRPDLEESLSIEIIGSIERSARIKLSMSKNISKIIQCIPPVPYLKSLEYMYDADILLLIEANVKNNLFLPSKLADYLGANVPIVGIVGPGEADRILDKLGSYRAYPEDIHSIAEAIENTVERVMHSQASWQNQKVRNSFCSDYIAKKFEAVLERV